MDLKSADTRRVYLTPKSPLHAMAGRTTVFDLKVCLRGKRRGRACPAQIGQPKGCPYGNCDSNRLPEKCRPAKCDGEGTCLSAFSLSPRVERDLRNAAFSPQTSTQRGEGGHVNSQITKNRADLFCSSFPLKNSLRSLRLCGSSLFLGKSATRGSRPTAYRPPRPAPPARPCARSPARARPDRPARRPAAASAKR